LLGSEEDLAGEDRRDGRVARPSEYRAGRRASRFLDAS